MRQSMAYARKSQADRFYLAHFLDVNDAQLYRLLRVNTSRFRRLER